MALDLALSAARSGLALLNRQMAGSANDVANAGTEGHTRKIIDGRAALAGTQGTGVRIAPARREVDEALATALDAARSAAAAAELRERLLSRIETAHGRPEDGDSLGGTIAALRSAFVALRESPAETIRQRDVAVAAEAVAKRLNGLAGAVGAARQEAQDGLVEEVAAANAALDEVARLTVTIRAERAAGRSTAALEDRRDAALARLAESIEVRTLKREDGGLVVVARGGLVLPLEPGRPAFSIAPATVGAAAFHGAGGTLPGVMLAGADVTRRLAGGRLAALAELRDATLPRFAAELDLSATHLAARFDAQGLRLFADAGGAVPDLAQPYDTGPALGFAAAIRVNPDVLDDPALLRDGTHAVAAGANGATAFTPNPAGGPPGFSAMLDRVLDFTFGTGPAPGAAHPPIPNAGLGPDGTLRSPLPGQATLEAHASALVAAQSAPRAEAARMRERDAALVETLAARRAERSGVDVDAEVARMVQLQTAYGVNARVLSTVQAMWDALLAAMR